MLTKKEIFEYSGFKLECGKEISLKIGYETYGTLNEKKDNCILVSHYFTASSHAAGYYTEKDELPGYWDGLIGPGKAVDTDKYFVLSCDNLCNIQIKDPYVVTTGPASVDPETGKPYGLTFPAVSTKDLANSQVLLLKSLGIEHVKAVMGPSLGGMVAMQIAIHMPDFADKFIGVVTAPYNYIGPSFQYAVWDAAKNDPNFNNGDYYGGEEPKYAIETVCKNLMLTIYSADYLEKLFERDPNEEEPYHDVFAVTCFEKKLAYIAKLMAANMDMNSWIYASHITMNHDIRHGFKDLDDAVKNIKAKTLLISNRQDNLENWHSSERMAQAINRTGGSAEFVLLDDELGHMTGMMRTDLFAEEVKDFLNN
ncbi:MAG TPA: homoserine O-acetyltransferase [Candidatus Alectryocaccobium stercorigallinarum]|nr:homoserine O-acetyltransferase [Candidatus Alectryocaccobium stercorigallinarum]